MKYNLPLLALAILSFTGLVIGYSNHFQTPATTNTYYNKTEAENFVQKLEQLGFFKYADTADLDSLKQNMIRYFDPENEITTIWNDSTGVPKDYRYYTCDGEEVYEQGGVINLLKFLKPTFDKLHFKCEITNHFEEWDTKKKWLNHRFSMNGTPYTIFKNFKEIGWGEAPKRIAEILNIELKKQGIEEQIYLVSGGNDGRLIFLSNEQYQYIYTAYKNPSWKPLELNEWAQVMGVKPMKLD